MGDATVYSDNLAAMREKRRRASGLRLVSAADKGIVKDHAQWRGREVMARRDVTHSFAAEGADRAISARTADRGCRMGVSRVLPLEGNSALRRYLGYSS